MDDDSAQLIENSITVELTREEATVARNMLNIALKAVGGDAAQAYLVLDGKFRTALDKAVE